MFAHYCEVTESDLDCLCLPIIVKLQNMIMISHGCPLLENGVTKLDQDLPCLPIVVKLQNMIRIFFVCPSGGGGGDGYSEFCLLHRLGLNI